MHLDTLEIQYLDACLFSIALTIAVAPRERNALTVYVLVSVISVISICKYYKSVLTTFL